MDGVDVVLAESSVVGYFLDMGGLVEDQEAMLL